MSLTERPYVMTVASGIPIRISILFFIIFLWNFFWNRFSDSWLFYTNSVVKCHLSIVVTVYFICPEFQFEVKIIRVHIRVHYNSGLRRHAFPKVSHPGEPKETQKKVATSWEANFLKKKSAFQECSFPKSPPLEMFSQKGRFSRASFSGKPQFFRKT